MVSSILSSPITGTSPSGASASSPAGVKSSPGDSVAGFTVYSYSALLAMQDCKEYPADVDTRCLEAYLSEDEFHHVIGVPYDDFMKQVKWKRDKKRKEVKLF